MRYADSVFGDASAGVFMVVLNVFSGVFYGFGVDDEAVASRLTSAFRSLFRKGSATSF